MPVQSLVRVQLHQYKKAMYFFLLLSKNVWFSYPGKIKRNKCIDQNQKFLKELIVVCCEGSAPTEHSFRKWK